MSAMLASDVTFDTLATFYVKHNLCVRRPGEYQFHDLRSEHAEWISLVLFNANVRSVSELYGDRSMTFRTKFEWVDDLPDPVAIVKLPQFFDYQACEVDDYEDSLAASIVRAIRNKAISLLSGYSQAPWGLPERPAKAVHVFGANRLAAAQAAA